MKVLVRDKEYKITFRVGKWAGSFYTGVVICDVKPIDRDFSRIFGYTFWAKHAGGFALCVFTDGFSPDEGRRIALTRALRKFSRWERKTIWKAYWAEVEEK